jgi:pSer/pThr/pTyr-binding forkhead associated (FHA) protein
LHSNFHLDNWLGGGTSTIASPANFAREVLRPEAQAWSMEQRVPRFVDKIVVGRGRSCDVVVPDPSISKQHAYLARTDGGAVVQDAGSRNGTFVNGRRLAAGERAGLGDGDILQLGPGVSLCFVMGSTLRLLVETL